MKIEVSLGEIVDKLSILDIKLLRINDKNKLVNVQKEYEYLLDIVTNEANFDLNSSEYEDLVEVNVIIWDAENEKREQINKNIFDETFINAARTSVMYNDKRAEIKKTINKKYNSVFIEEKEHKI